MLGTSQLDWACFLTQIQRQLREHVNPDVTISFDSASATLNLIFEKFVVEKLCGLLVFTRTVLVAASQARESTSNGGLKFVAKEI